MIECASCHTLNPDSEALCLMCGVALAAAPGAAAAPAARCSAGHPIDPSWRSCPYCDRQQAAATASAMGRSTRVEGAPGAPLAPTRLEAGSPAAGRGGAGPLGAAGAYRRTRLEVERPPAPVFAPSPAAVAAGGPKATRLESAATAPHRTVLAPPPSRAQEASGTAAAAPISSSEAVGRRLVGVLAAPGLGAGGTVFAVREGKNSIGGDRANDVCLAADATVSSEHALLLHRRGVFYLADRLSTNGTSVDGVELPANGTIELRDRACIRCGGTDLVLLILDRAGDGGAASADAAMAQ